MVTSIDVFISYSSRDESIARDLCNYLEKKGYRCWIASRNITGSRPYAVEIVEAIKVCKVMLVVFTQNTNLNAKHIASEIDLAFTNDKIILTFKVGDIPFGEDFVYYLGNKQWIKSAADPRMSFKKVYDQILLLEKKEIGGGANRGATAGGEENGGATTGGETNTGNINGLQAYFFKYKYLAAILVVVILGGWYIYKYSFKNSVKEPVKDYVVIGNFTDDESIKKDGRINSDKIIYLITDRFLHASTKNIVTSDEFQFRYGKDEFPEMKITGQFIVNQGYSIKIQFYEGNGTKRVKQYSFNEPEALLGARMDIIDSIVQIITGGKPGKPIPGSYTFTKSWNAFKEFYEGEKAWQRLDMTNATTQFKTAIDQDSGFILPKLRYAQLLNFSGYFLLAKDLIRSIMPDIGQLCWRDSLKAIALEYRLNGSLVEETQILTSVSERYPIQKEVLYDIAESYFVRCNVEDAMIYYQKVLDIDKGFALAHNHIAYCYSARGKHHDALHHFKIYVSLDKTANSYDSYGDGFMAAGKLDSAEWAKMKGISIDPKVYYLRGSLGFINLRQGRFREADQNFQRYIDMTHQIKDKKAQAGGYYRKALIPYYKGLFKDGIDSCLKAIKIYDTIDMGTRDHEMHWLLGYLYLLNDQPDKAELELAEMTKLANKNGINSTKYRQNFYKYMLHLRIALSAYHSQVPEMLKIMEEFDGPIKDKIKDHTSPFDLAFFNTSFGELWMRPNIHRLDLAEERFKKALAYNPDYALAHYYLWRLFQIEGKVDSADVHQTRFDHIWKHADDDVRRIYGLNEEVNPLVSPSVLNGVALANQHFQSWIQVPVPR